MATCFSPHSGILSSVAQGRRNLRLRPVEEPHGHELVGHLSGVGLLCRSVIAALDRRVASKLLLASLFEMLSRLGVVTLEFLNPALRLGTQGVSALKRRADMIARLSRFRE